MPTDRIMETLRPYQERITLLEEQLRAAEEREGELRRTLELIRKEHADNAAKPLNPWDYDAASIRYSHRLVKAIDAALASAPTQGEAGR